MIKGKTKIELKDVNTGEVEVVEEENMVTDALKHVFAPMGLVKAAATMYSSEYADYYTTLTGGLVLLNKALEEDAGNYILPEGVKQTGCAAYDQQNTSNQTLRGNYNATESEFDRSEKRVKYVYDFDTAEGNGTIACVALTHVNGGFGNQGIDTAPVRTAHPFFKTIGSGLLRLSGNNSAIGGHDRTLNYTNYGTGYNWIFKIDGEKDSAYYFTIMSTTQINVKRYRANIKTLSFFDKPASYRRLMETTEVKLTKAINRQYFSYSYDDEKDKLYIVTNSSYNVSSNGSYIITEIDLANDCAVTQYEMTNKCGESIQIGYRHADTFCYRGYIYFISANSTSSVYGVYRQEIGNSANVQKMATGFSYASTPWLAREGKVYFENNYGGASSAGLYIVDTESFTAAYPESYTLYDGNIRQFIRVQGYPMTYYVSYGTNDGTFTIRTDYLATINNLSTPVVKTADKTMKVTYTLEEVDE